MNEKEKQIVNQLISNIERALSIDIAKLAAADGRVPLSLLDFQRNSISQLHEFLKIIELRKNLE
jgi:hypothetical protein